MKNEMKCRKHFKNGTFTSRWQHFKWTLLSFHRLLLSDKSSIFFFTRFSHLYFIIILAINKLATFIPTQIILKIKKKTWSTTPHNHHAHHIKLHYLATSLTKTVLMFISLDEQSWWQCCKFSSHEPVYKRERREAKKHNSDFVKWSVTIFFCTLGINFLLIKGKHDTKRDSGVNVSDR